MKLQLKPRKPKRTAEQYAIYLKHWRDHYANVSFLYTLPCTGGCWVVLEGTANLVPLNRTVFVSEVHEFYADKAIASGKVERLFFTVKLYSN